MKTTKLVRLASTRKDYAVFGLPGGRPVVYVALATIDGETPTEIEVGGIVARSSRREASADEKFDAARRLAERARKLLAEAEASKPTMKPTRTRKPKPEADADAEAENL